MNAPCYRCGRKEPGCHSRCGEYMAFRERIDKAAKAKAAEQPAVEFAIERVKRCKEFYHRK